MNARRDWIICILALLPLLLLFFLFSDRPLHVDGPLYSLLADNLLRQPVSPYSGEYSTRNMFSESGLDIMLHPPFIIYFLATLKALFGESVEAYRLCFFLFPLIAVFSFAFLAKRFVSNSNFATILLGVSPLFAVSSLSIMTDVPLLAFYLLSVTLFFRALEKESLLSAFWAGFAGLLAVSVKYTALTLVPLWLVTTLLFGKTHKWRSLGISTGIVLVFFLVFNFWTDQLYGTSHFLNSLGLVVRGETLSYFPKLVGGVAFLGGLSTFPLVLLLPLYRERFRLATALPLLAFIVLALVAALRTQDTNSTIAMMAFFLFGVGVVLTKAFIQLLEQPKEILFLVAWVVGGLLVAVLGTPFLAARFLVLALCPFLLLFVRIYEPLRLGSYVETGAIISSFALSFILAATDYSWAIGYKNLPAQVVEKCGRSQTYFLNHWGMQFYGERAGFRLYEDGTIASPGDLIISSSIVPGKPASEINAILRKRVDIEIESPYRVKLNGEGAGFYIHHSGLLPYVLSPNALDVVTCYEVAR